MKNKAEIAIIGAMLVLGPVAQSSAQSNLVQPLTFSLTANNQSNSNAVQRIRITTKDVINLFAGTSVARGQLLLVTPPGNTPGAAGVDLNAFLRVTSGGNTVVEVPTPASFNLFQDFASVSSHGASTTTYALNRFSIDFGSFHSELQGFSTWHTVARTVGGVDLSGSGSFSSPVNGEATVDGVTQGSVPTQGTISAGAPKPGP